MLFRNRASSNLYQSQIANLKKGRLTLEGSLIIKGNYYYAKFRVNGKQKMIATKIPVKGSNKRRAEQKMKEIIADQLGVSEDEVTLEASFKEDLDADSLDLFELVMALEEEYNVEIPSEDLAQLNTVEDVIKYLNEKGVE